MILLATESTVLLIAFATNDQFVVAIPKPRAGNVFTAEDLMAVLL